MSSTTLSPSSKPVILYVHGMGGGGDSRIPAILKTRIPEAEIVVRTYDFDPDASFLQLDSWFEELHPVLVIGESLGSTRALRFKSVPRLLVCPAINVPVLFSRLAGLALIPGIRPLLNRIYRPAEGDRQRIDFKFSKLRHYSKLKVSQFAPTQDYVHAFFGTRDKFRRTGIVSVTTWRRLFGEGSWTEFEGEHHMDEANIDALLVPAIRKILTSCL